MNAERIVTRAIILTNQVKRELELDDRYSGSNLLTDRSPQRIKIFRLILEGFLYNEEFAEENINGEVSE